jgi:hypothetical protein
MEKMVTFSAQGSAGLGQPAPVVEVPEEGTALENASLAGQEGTPATGLTADQIRKIVQEETEKALDSVSRRSQSQIAKAENRIKQLVNAQLATLKDANINVTPQQAQDIEQTIRAKINGQPEPTETPAAQPGEEGTPDADTDDPVSLAGFALMESLGVDLKMDDPEAALLDQSSSSAYLKSLSKALLAKQARLSTPPEARTPAGGGALSGKPRHAGLSGTDTLAMGFAEALNGR